eukprot:550589-Amphidinium_carterae.2
MPLASAHESLVLHNWDTTNQNVPRSLVLDSYVLGRGSFGTTWMGHLLAADEIVLTNVAVKCLDLSETDAWSLYNGMLEAIELPGFAPHPNLVQLRGYETARLASRGTVAVWRWGVHEVAFKSSVIDCDLFGGVEHKGVGIRLGQGGVHQKHTCKGYWSGVIEGCLHWRHAVIMELCEGNLEWFCQRPDLHAHERLKLMEQVAAGCAHLARGGNVHANLKMQNILILNHVAKVADFGFSLRARIAGMHDDRSAESTAESTTEKDDVYSFGHIMLRTFCLGKCQVPVDQAQAAALVAKAWEHSDPGVSDKHCNEAAKWICKSVEVRAKKRPSFATIGGQLKSLREAVENCTQSLSQPT